MLLWNIEIPNPISAEVSCSGKVWKQRGRGDESVSVTFGWSIELGNSEKERLRKGENISKQAKVSIKKSDSREDWWPVMKGQDLETLYVWANPRGNRLSIGLTRTQEPQDPGPGAYVVYGGGEENKNLTCETRDLLVGEGSGRRIYSRATRKGMGGKWIPHDNGNLTVGVSLEKCEIKGKEIECSLNVVTGSIQRS